MRFYSAAVLGGCLLFSACSASTVAAPNPPESAQTVTPTNPTAAPTPTDVPDVEQASPATPAPAQPGDPSLFRAGDPGIDLPVVVTDDRLLISDLFIGSISVIDLGRQESARIEGARRSAIWFGGLEADSFWAQTGNRIERHAWNGDVLATVIRDTGAVLAPRTALGDGALAFTTADFDAEEFSLVIVERNGDERCQAQIADQLLLVLFGSDLVDISTGEMFDPATCQPNGVFPARIVQFDSNSQGDRIYADTRDDVQVRLDRTETGWVVTATADLGIDFASDIAIHEQGIWVASPIGVFILDPESLEPRGQAVGPTCGDGPRLFTQPDLVYVVDDCTQRLAVIDALSLDQRTLDLPWDQSSAASISGVQTPNGIWLANREAGYSPYFFSFDRQRFERLPDRFLDPERSTWGLGASPGG